MGARLNEAKRINKLVEAAFNKIGKNRQFNVMDLGKIHDAGVSAAHAGRDVEEAVKAACDQYETKPEVT